MLAAIAPTLDFLAPVLEVIFSIAYFNKFWGVLTKIDKLGFTVVIGLGSDSK